MRIYLLGFMASGKSTLGKQVAKKINARFIDLDDFVEEHVGQSIADFFAEKGEFEFRKIESELLRKLPLEDKLVIALGGVLLASTIISSTSMKLAFPFT